jgi:DNA sulfur modification protein DndC
MTFHSKTLFDSDRLTATDATGMTLESLKRYGARHRHWAVAWSGGKDSTALLTMLVHFLESGQLERPETLTVCYADTRMELPPLAAAARSIGDQLRARGIELRIVMAEMDKRFFVYMLGRGVPPPNNNTFRWCTRQIKVEPMEAELRRLVGDRGEKVLMLTGVRQGESAVRDQRIVMSCGKNGAECGQGWYQETLPETLCDTLAPLLHWRVCHIWDWLSVMAPLKKYGGWDTADIAMAYGSSEAEEINARTGCVGCPLANVDTALDVAIRSDRWSHLAPLKELRPLYRELREPRNRLRQPGGETRQDGTLTANQHRMGPLTMESRRMALAKILDIQDRINRDARLTSRPEIDILNAEEVARIKELIAANTWPRKWSGNEPLATEPFEEGHEQMTLYSISA